MEKHTPPEATARPQTYVEQKMIYGWVMSIEDALGTVTVQLDDDSLFTFGICAGGREQLVIGTLYRFDGMGLFRHSDFEMLEFQVPFAEGVVHLIDIGLNEAYDRIGEALGPEGIAMIRDMNDWNDPAQFSEAR